MTENRPSQILVAEDSAADVGLIRMALDSQKLYCSVAVAKDGAQAIAYIEKPTDAAGVDLLFLDMHPPENGGEDVLRCLRSTERSEQTPVVVMTSSDAERDDETAQRHAAYHYFRRPSELGELMQLGEIVREVLLKGGVSAGDIRNHQE